MALLFLFPILLAAQPAGILPDWEIQKSAESLEKHTAAIESLLSQLRPQEWISQGAPEAYVEQWKQTRQFNSYLTTQARLLARDPAKLSVALDAFLRVDHLQSLLESVAAGVRRYQNAALADLLSSAMSQNSATRELLKDYTRQLVVEREKEWEIANREAQRCRASLAKKPSQAKP